jgi:hypothetical protein
MEKRPVEVLRLVSALNARDFHNDDESERQLLLMLELIQRHENNVLVLDVLPHLNRLSIVRPLCRPRINPCRTADDASR